MDVHLFACALNSLCRLCSFAFTTMVWHYILVMLLQNVFKCKFKVAIKYKTPGSPLAKVSWFSNGKQRHYGLRVRTSCCVTLLCWNKKVWSYCLKYWFPMCFHYILFLLFFIMSFGTVWYSCWLKCTVFSHTVSVLRCMSFKKTTMIHYFCSCLLHSILIAVPVSHVYMFYHCYSVGEIFNGLCFSCQFKTMRCSYTDCKCSLLPLCAASDEAIAATVFVYCF